ncbi:bel12-ag transposon polyprotein [Trichonephila inaurata madagascariensis]|uniref:Bel12-ag transposon polyprotein n=1 Tax=Trichonephila inaurata madagascariensis TaxID=2747483 RepID=A0A8X6ID94_9ARAC|nr:bel12-ag transposon polyprotein [Trichonephila inaurata madagascariensis]
MMKNNEELKILHEKKLLSYKECQRKSSELNKLLAITEKELQQKESETNSLRNMVKEKECQFDELSQMIDASLKRLDWAKIQREFKINQIRWKFNPPSAPWWGGFWERLIGILKDVLRKNFGRSSLTYEELFTLVCECESVMNSRPLISEEPDLKALTPSSFLQDLPNNDVPDMDKIHKTNINKRDTEIKTNIKRKISN